MACPSNCGPYLAAALCNASNSSFFQYVTTNLAPSSRNARLIARPNPPVPPATNTTLPENLVPISLLEPVLSIVVLDGLPLHRQFRLQTLQIARDSRCRERTPALAVAHRAVARVERAVDLHIIPAFGVTDIVDREIVMLAPEERHCIEPLLAPEYVPRRRLALPLGN